MPIVYRYVAERVNGRADLVDDIVQDAYLSAVDRIEQYDPQRGALGQWLLGITHRKIIEHFRRARRDTILDQATLESLKLLDRSPLPDEVAEQMELRQAVRTALLQLRPDYRRVLTDRYEESRSLEEIARRQGRTRKSVESLLRRARRSLGKLLKNSTEAEGG